MALNQQEQEVLSRLERFEGYSQFRKLGRMHGFYEKTGIIFYLNTSENVEAYFLMPHIDGIDYNKVYEFIRIAKRLLNNPL